MRRVILFLFCSLLLSLSAENRKEMPEVPRTIRELPGNMSYSVPGLGLKFPPNIAAYKKISVTENANPVYGTVIRYMGSKGESADIYLYSNDTSSSPLQERMLLPEYEKTKEALLKNSVPSKKSAPAKLPVKEEIKLIKEETIKSHPSSRFSMMYRCDFHCFLGENKYESMMLLALVKGEWKKTEKNSSFHKFIKIRLSRPSEVTSGGVEAEKFLLTLLKNMDKPSPEVQEEKSPAKGQK